MHYDLQERIRILYIIIHVAITGLRQLEKIIAVIEESTTERRRMHKEAMTRQDKLLDILEKINTK